MRRSAAMRATTVGIMANAFLLVLKGAATGLSDSLTIFSETLNSLADLLTAFVVLICVRWAWMSPDEEHPFGHRRAEPIAGLLAAIFTGILGFEVCRTAIIDLWHGNLPAHIGRYPILALCITALLKFALARYFAGTGQALNSPAIRATAVDCRNDVLIAMQGLFAVVVANYELRSLDTLAALVVGVYILYSGYRVGMENIDYLMGKAPDRDLLDRIRTAAAGVTGVHEVDDVLAHYVGTFIHVELTARVDGTLTTAESHDVAEATRHAVESVGLVHRAFVHIEPAKASRAASQPN